MIPRARVTYFINSLEQGGAERQLVELIKALDRDRYDPSLVLCSRLGSPASLPEDCEIHTLDAEVFPSPFSLQRLVSLFQRLKPDLVHTFKPYENAFGRWAARKAGVRRVVSSVRSPTLPLGVRLAESLTWHMADLVLVNSVGIQSAYSQGLRVARDSMRVIENGVDTERFRRLSNEERAAVRARYGLGDARVILLSGRLSPEKSQRETLEALGALLRGQKLPEDLRVVFAGRDSLWLYGKSLRASARRLGLGGLVRFVGDVGDIEALVASSDVLLLPSRFEGLPNAALEAMACGVPVVLSEAANADGLVSDGVEGMVLASHHPGCIARGISRIASLGQGEREAMGQRGRAAVLRRFAMERMVRRTESVYAGLLREAV